MAVTVYASMVDGSAAKVKAYIDSLALTTINNLAVTPYGQKILVVVEGT